MPDPSPAAFDGLPAATLLDRACGAYLGLAIGGALGATVEFMTPAQIRARHGVHRELIGGGWLQQPARCSSPASSRRSTRAAITQQAEALLALAGAA